VGFDADAPVEFVVALELVWFAVDSDDVVFDWAITRELVDIAPKATSPMIIAEEMDMYLFIRYLLAINYIINIYSCVMYFRLIRKSSILSASPVPYRYMFEWSLEKILVEAEFQLGLIVCYQSSI